MDTDCCERTTLRMPGAMCPGRSFREEKVREWLVIATKSGCYILVLYYLSHFVLSLKDIFCVCQLSVNRERLKATPAGTD